MVALRMAVRALRATPVVSLVVIATLGLGIGANTAIFTVVNSLLLRTLPVPAPDRLVTVSSDYALAHGFKSGVGWNYQMWKRLQTMPPLFEGVLLWSQPTFNFARGGERRTGPGTAREREASSARSGSRGACRSSPDRRETTSRAEGRTDRSSSSATACGKSASAGLPETIGASLTLDGVPVRPLLA